MEKKYATIPSEVKRPAKASATYRAGPGRWVLKAKG